MYTEYIKQWKHFSSQYGEQTCLFLMVGKFYELYDILEKTTREGQTNMKQAVETLGITLTVRDGDGPNGESCLFAGFPEQSLQKFAALLTREGWTVVVCDQAKDSSGRVQGRPVSRIFSPGTHIEVATADAPYLGGLWLQESLDGAPLYAACVIDLTTGHLVSYQSKCQGSQEIWSADELVHFFQVHPPRELVIWWRGAPLARPCEAIFRRRFGLPKCALHLELANSQDQGALETPLVRKSYLEGIFSKKLCLLPILDQLSLRTKPLTERVLVCLLRFAEEHLPSAIERLHEHNCWTPETSVYMGNNSLAQLNYISTGSEQSVLSLFHRCLSSLGKRAMRERLLTPSSNGGVIDSRLREVQFFYERLGDESKRVESCLRLVHDMARLHRKIVINAITAADVLALDQSYGASSSLADLLGNGCMQFLNYYDFSEYRKVFASCFDIEKAKLAVQQEDKSFLPATKAPKTFELESKLSELRTRITGLVETLRQWIGLPEEALRIESFDTVPFVITATKTTLGIVKRKMQSVPMDSHPCKGLVIHEKKTGRGAIDFPLLSSLNGQTISLRYQFQAAFKEELPAICREVESATWGLVERWVAHVDVTLALAKVAKERGYTRPILVEQEGGCIEAIGLRHPLLESIQTQLEYVKHNVSLGADDSEGWLLYGMNASGKSSLMKSIGVSVLLAQAGSYVPASIFKLSPFKSVLTRILNQDNLWAGLSSFAVEVSELRDIFHRADNWSLVLGDELCSGTESISATSLVAAGIKFLHGKSVRFVFATHLHGLLSLSDISTLPNLGIWHLRVHYDPAKDILIYDRTLHKGPGGTLYGLEVARAMHLSHDLLKLAHAYRRELQGETSLEDSAGSTWNARIIRKECQLCKHPITRDLEVHHIRPRAEATDRMFEDGTSMNDLRNLIVVCQSCHDKHHAGELEIGPQVQTSAGPQRLAVQTAPAKKTKSKWSEEQLKTIEETLRKYPHLAIPRLVYDLKQQEDIEISEAQLRKMRNSLV
jgi:DNA mismatch repair protein MutS